MQESEDADMTCADTFGAIDSFVQHSKQFMAKLVELNELGKAVFAHFDFGKPNKIAQLKLDLFMTANPSERFNEQSFEDSNLEVNFFVYGFDWF